MRYKCLECGNTFEQGEQSAWEEEHGERFCGCPFCQSDFDEVIECAKCGADVLESDSENGWCSSCIESEIDRYRWNFAACYELTAKLGEKDEVSIDSFLASVFSEQEIEEILFKSLYERASASIFSCDAFINSDKRWFIDAITKKGVKQ